MRSKAAGFHAERDVCEQTESSSHPHAECGLRCKGLLAGLLSLAPGCTGTEGLTCMKALGWTARPLAKPWKQGGPKGEPPTSASLNLRQELCLRVWAAPGSASPQVQGAE